MKRPYFIIIFLLGLVVVLSVGKAILQNSFSTSGIIVSKAEQEISFYKTQNAILSEELLTASSLTAIIERANKSGFTSKNKLMVIKTSSPLAAKP
jgi:cell division protein FtsL